MKIGKITITLHANLYFESSTLGHLVVTQPDVLHNIALCYALGLAQTTYHHRDDIPAYKREIQAVNERGIYVYPAMAQSPATEINSRRFARHGEANHIGLLGKDLNKNLPLFERTKEVRLGTQYTTFVVSQDEIELPTWIRLGKDDAKARTEIQWTGASLRAYDGYPIRWLINPEDLPEGIEVGIGDVHVMRPNSLLSNVTLDYLSHVWSASFSDAIALPIGMQHLQRFEE